MERRYDETSTDLDSNYLIPVLAVPEGANKIVASRLVSRVRGQQVRYSKGLFARVLQSSMAKDECSSP